LIARNVPDLDYLARLLDEAGQRRLAGELRARLKGPTRRPPGSAAAGQLRPDAEMWKTGRLS
jgi:hypothetical protein